MVRDATQIFSVGVGTFSLKMQSDLGTSYTYLSQNFTSNSMVVIIFVKNLIKQMAAILK